MKKTSLFIAALFATSFAMAQNNAETEQEGNNNVSSTVQTGNNTAYTLQITNGNATVNPSNISEISQVGIGNDATVEQVLGNSFPGGAGHFASVSQSGGDENTAYVRQEQRGASATIDQVGSNNFAGLKQAGPNDAGVQGTNVAGIYQFGNGNSLRNANFSSNAYMKNGSSFDNDKNFLQVDQIGDNNRAGATIEHHADVTIYQLGNGNDASVFSVSNPYGAINLASILQEGSGNDASIRQERGGMTGDGNDASIEQEGMSNTASILQSGDLNVATIMQFGDLNSGSISQTGAGHVGSIYQNGMGNSAIVTQNP